MRIGVYLKRQNWKDPYVASDRFRGDWVMQHCPEMEEWQPGVEYYATIFHNAVPEIAIGKGVKILDVCDPIWGHAIHNFRKTIEPGSAIVTTTERMRADALKVVPDKPVYVIGDGHHFPFYETREPNLHSRTARVAVWFGYAANAACLRPLLPVLREFNLTLKIIAERNPFPADKGIDFVKLGLDSFVREISIADFAILPVNKLYKSNNKDISALLCGIPVAKNVGDIAWLTFPDNRRREMKNAQAIIEQHDVRDRAQEYYDLA